MNISQVLNSSAIWSTPSRTITGFNGAISSQGVVAATIAGGTTANFQPPVGTNWDIVVAAGGNSNITWSITIGNASGSTIVFNGAAGALASYSTIANNTVFLKLTNVSAVVGNYSTCINAWVS